MADPDLEARLLAAHDAADGALLSRLYTEAAIAAQSADAKAFFLTHAWIWALEAGAPEARDIEAELSRLKRV